ncbi:MAG: antitoxin family protein [Myxococcales bacterium]
MRLEAVYESGVLKLRMPLPLPEHTHVHVEVEVTADFIPTLPRDAWNQAFGSIALGGNALTDSEAYYDAP